MEHLLEIEEGVEVAHITWTIVQTNRMYIILKDSKCMYCPIISSLLF